MATTEFDPDTDRDAGDPREWTPVKHGRRTSQGGAVLSVRISGELAEGLQSLARTQDTSMSDMARRLLADAVATSWPATTLNIRVTDQLSVTYGHGPRTTGGESKQRTAEALGVFAPAAAGPGGHSL
jgi:hypothetical protein